MFWDDLKLVTEQVEKYGFAGPLLDVAGEGHSEVTDFELTRVTGNQRARTVSLLGRPFDHIDPSYQSLSLTHGESILEKLKTVPQGKAGTVVALQAIERVDDPFALFETLARILDPNGVLIISSLFSYPFQHGRKDLWRVTPETLSMLASRAGLQVLEAGWRLNIPAGYGIINPETGEPQEVRSAYATCVRGSLHARVKRYYVLPQRHSSDPKIAPFLSTGESVHDVKITPEVTASTREPVTATRKRCLFVNSYYLAFLESFYQQNPQMLQAPYAVQMAALQQTRFGDSDFYSEGLQDAGWEAANVISNCAPLQNAWCREQGIQAGGLGILLAQVEAFRPDVLYCQDMNALSPEFLELARRSARVIVGQHASSINLTKIPAHLYDLVVTSLAPLTDFLEGKGIRAFTQPLAFYHQLHNPQTSKTHALRQYPLSFVGGLHSAVHHSRKEFLESIASKTPVQMWGYGASELAADSPVRARYQGEAWGMPMFNVLLESRMTLNRHGEVWIEDGSGIRFDAAARYANNMRLFEATGCGALLITDYRDNLNQLFEIGREVVAYRTIDECESLVKYYTQYPAEAERIANAGRERTLRDHTYQRRMKETAGILDRLLTS